MSKLTLIFFIILSCLSEATHAGPPPRYAYKPELPSQEIVIAGDSWSVLVCLFNGLDNALEKEGLKARTTKHCTSSETMQFDFERASVKSK